MNLCSLGEVRRVGLLAEGRAPMMVEGGREHGTLKSCEAEAQQVPCQDMVNEGPVVR